MAADLHCHTKLSDGTLSIEELVLLAKARGLGAIAVTDHDTFAGTGRAVVFGKRKGIEVVPGAELSTLDAKTGRKAHILCYYCAHPDRLQGLCHRTAEARRHAAQRMLQKVERLYPISTEMVNRRAQGSTNIYKQHIMHALMDAGYTNEVFGSLFQMLFNAHNGLAYAPVEYPETRDVLRQVHEAGGVAVLAHPGVYDSYDLMEELAASHLIDGVEAFHPRNKPGDEERFRAVADKYGLLMTGGTDFHGAYSKAPHPLGTCTASDAQLAALKCAAEAVWLENGVNAV